MQRGVGELSREWKVVLACAVMFFWSVSFRSVFFSLVPEMASEFHLSPTEAGFLVSTFFSGYGIAVWIAGYVPGSRRSIIGLGFGLSIVAILIFYLTKITFLLYLFGPIGAFGVGLYLPRGLSLISEFSTAGTRGRNMSIHEIAANLALMLGPLFAGFGIAHFGWRTSYLLWGLIGISTLALLGIVREFCSGCPDSGPVLAKEARRESSIAGIILKEKFFLFVLAFTSIFLLIMGFISVLPILMVNAWGVDSSYAASFVGATRFVAVLGLFFSGALSDRFGRRPVFLSIFLVAFIFTALMTFGGPGILFTISVVAMTAAAGGATPVFYAALAEYYPDSVREKAMGLVSGTASLCSQVGFPALLGFLIDHFQPAVTFGTVWCYTAIGTLAAVRLLKRYSPAIESAPDPQLPSTM